MSTDTSRSILGNAKSARQEFLPIPFTTQHGAVPGSLSPLPTPPGTFSFQKAYGGVTSEVVVRRLRQALAVDGSLLEELQGLEGDDLWGPVWIASTVAVLVFVTGCVAQELGARLLGAAKGRATLVIDYSGLATALFLVSGTIMLETVYVWAAEKYFLKTSAGISPVQCITLSGYSLTLLGPMAVISAVPWGLLQLVALGTTGALSCLFLYRNLMPCFRRAGLQAEQSAPLLLGLFMLHFGLFLALKTCFYHAPQFF